ncbi:MAG: DUF1292 domain-containing protein [Lachnospiraceae bacterium]|nr:DUF1292 domain-containing protein [Lachnospiraceae bacterium]MCI5586815.1 DUF1292 domain-containing protein [Lachnospiraceae bacterium]
MNEKNKKFIFESDDDEMVAVVTLTDTEGNEFDAEIIAALEIEEMGREFIAVVPEEGAPDFEENEAMVLEYFEDEDGEPQFAAIEDEELFETVTEAFDKFFNEADYELEDNNSSLGYLGDIGNIIPGVSIKED